MTHDEEQTIITFTCLGHSGTIQFTVIGLLNLLAKHLFHSSAPAHTSARVEGLHVNHTTEEVDWSTENGLGQRMDLNSVDASETTLPWTWKKQQPFGKNDGFLLGADVSNENHRVARPI